jgi:hypothetical protein
MVMIKQQLLVANETTINVKVNVRISPCPDGKPVSSGHLFLRQFRKSDCGLNVTYSRAWQAENLKKEL